MKTVWRVFAYLKRYPWMAAGTLTGDPEHADGHCFSCDSEMDH